MKNTTWSHQFGCYSTVSDIVPTIPAGMYTIGRNPREELSLYPKDIVSSEFIDLPDTPQDHIFKLLNSFVNRRHIFEQFNLVHKRGILLYGPPGSGKTTIIQQASRRIVKDYNGIVIFGVSPSHASHMLNQIRTVEKERLIVVIFEEIESLVNDFGEHDFLSLLDGEMQINNVVFLATSNYPEMLSERLTNRPSRFDEIIPVGMPTYECRLSYLKAKYSALGHDLMVKWAKETDGMSLAHMQELVIATVCLEKDFNETITRLKNMKTERISSDSFKNPFGFLGTATAKTNAPVSVCRDVKY